MEISRGRQNTVSKTRLKIEISREVPEKNSSFSDGTYVQGNRIWFGKFLTSTQP